jgi:hypothetical protein
MNNMSYTEDYHLPSALADGLLTIALLALATGYRAEALEFHIYLSVD